LSAEVMEKTADIGRRYPDSRGSIW
jgi:hypothetical protein